MIYKISTFLMALIGTQFWSEFSFANSPDSTLTVCVIEPERESNQKVFENVVKLEAEAFRRLGLSASFNYYPSKRGLAQFLSQSCDFSAIRVPLPDLSKKGILRIDVPVAAPHLVVLGKEAEPKIPLKKASAYVAAIDRNNVHIGYLRNTMYVQRSVDKYKKAQVSAISNEAQGLKLLKTKRFDYFIGIVGGLVPFQKKLLGLPIVGRSRISFAYMFTHTKHLHLKNKIEKVLLKMKKEDEWKAYFPL